MQPKGAYSATEGDDGTKRVQSKVQLTTVSRELHGAKWRSWVHDRCRDGINALAGAPCWVYMGQNRVLLPLTRARLVTHEVTTAYTYALVS